MIRKVAYFFFLSTLFLLPSYLVRGVVFSMPFNLLDILEEVTVLFCLFLFFESQKRKELFATIWKQGFVIAGVLLIFFGALISAYMSGGFQSHELGIVKSWIVLPFLFVFFGQACGFSLRKGLSLYIFSAFGVAFISLWLPEASSVTYDGRLRGWYESPNQLAMYLAPAWVLSWFWWREKKAFQKILVFFFLSFVLWQTQSLGALLSGGGAILVGEIFFLFTRRAFSVSGSDTTSVPNLKYRPSFIWVGICVLAVLALTSIFSFKEMDLSGRSSLASRIMIWTSAVHISRDHPIFGIGPGNFQEKYLEYQKYYPPYLEWAVPHPHNTVLAFWLYSGVFGCTGFFLVCFVAIYRFWQNKKTANLYRIGVFCVFLSIFLYGFVDMTVWGNAGSILFWFILLAVTRPS